jgi:C4-dicarboxylate transporter DctQ subunit
VKNIIKKWNQVEIFLVGLLAIAAVAFVFYGVLGRYVFKAAPDWIEEISIYMLIWSAYLVASILVAENGHVGATFVIEHFPIKARRIVEIFISILALGFSVIVIWYGLQIVFGIYAADQKSSTSLRFPLWIPYLAVPAGYVLVGMRYLIRIYRLIFKFQISEMVAGHEMSREGVNP